MEFIAGAAVNPNVRLLRPLGEGAMGKVWVAEHLTLGTEVAVKFISAELAAQYPDVVKRFEREASVAAKLKSPHVVQTFDRGLTEDGTPFIVMELLEGKSLFDLLASGTLSLPDTAAVVVQVARALRRAHELGIVHRDIKPDNLFVSSSDEGLFCKVLDFGIAKQGKLPALQGLTTPGTLIGTPEYMSPEQFTSTAEADERADLWALSVTAYQCLTGEFPFPGETLGVLCAQLLKGDFLPPSQHRPELGAPVDAWFATAFARDPAARFGSARELARSFALLVDPDLRSFEDTLAESRRTQGESSARGTMMGLGPKAPASDPAVSPVVSRSGHDVAPSTLVGASSDASSVALPAKSLGRRAIALGAIVCAGLGVGAWVMSSGRAAAPSRSDGTSAARSDTSAESAASTGSAVPVVVAAPGVSPVTLAAGAASTASALAPRGEPAVATQAAPAASVAPTTSSAPGAAVVARPVASAPPSTVPASRPASPPAPATPKPGNYGF